MHLRDQKKINYLTGMRDTANACCVLRDDYREASINSKSLRFAVTYCAYGRPITTQDSSIQQTYAAGLSFKLTLKRDREGSCVSTGSGITPECVMHCESGFVQNFVTGRVWLSCS